MQILLKSGLFISIVLLISLYAQATNEDIDSITWATVKNPPYNYQDDQGIPTGISIDVVKKLMVKLGSKKTVRDIEFLSWARSYQNLQNNKNYALFITSRTEARENIFKWVGPISRTKMIILAKKSNKIKIKSVEDLSKYTIGAVNNAAPYQLLIKMSSNLKFELTTDLNQCIEKLKADRIDMVAGPEDALRYWLQKYKYKQNDFETIYMIKEVSDWIAFNKDTSSSLVQSIQSALDTLQIINSKP